MDVDDSGAGDAAGVADRAVDGAAVSLLPHFEQNFAPGRLVPPQDGQPTGTGAPHSSQNRLPSGMSAVQLGHSMPHLSRHKQPPCHRSDRCGCRLVWAQPSGARRGWRVLPQRSTRRHAAEGSSPAVVRVALFGWAAHGASATPRKSRRCGGADPRRSRCRAGGIWPTSCSSWKGEKPNPDLPEFVVLNALDDIAGEMLPIVIGPCSAARATPAKVRLAARASFITWPHIVLFPGGRTWPSEWEGGQAALCSSGQRPMKRSVPFWSI